MIEVSGSGIYIGVSAGDRLKCDARNAGPKLRPLIYYLTPRESQRKLHQTMRKILPYHLGLIIPSTIILVNGLTTYYSVIIFDPELSRRTFLFVYASVWLFYASAVLVSPGYTDGTEVTGGDYIECLKCNKPKPERAHHCRVCKRCVLMMDHHCPWTENCVGHKNFGHFLRFLVAAAGLNAYGAYRCGSFLVYIYHNRRFKHRILPNNTRLWLGGLGMCLDAFITLTVGVLLLRVISDSSNGQTQIENWEQERVESLYRKRLAPRTIFPFDVGLRSNLETFFGQFPLDWMLPWGSARGSGHVFPKLFATTERWPPRDNTEVRNHGYYRADRWINFEGETLHDFGVDQEAEYRDSSAVDHGTDDSTSWSQR